MKIKKIHGERCFSHMVHSWFNENLDIWERYRCGEIIEVPNEYAAEIKKLCVGKIEIIEDVEVIKPTKGKAKPEPKVVEEGEI